MIAHIDPVLQQLSSRNQNAILDLLRESGRANCPASHLAAPDRTGFDDGADIVSPTVRWMAGVYLGDELTSFVRVRDGSFAGQMETTLFVDTKWRRRGIGTLLLEATIEWASLRQASTLRFVCARTDWPMRHFARKFGARLDLVLGQLVADIPLGQRIQEPQSASSPG